MYCTPHEICVIYICLQNWSMPTPYQIWGEDLNRTSKYNLDSTETYISTRLIELHFHRTSNILVRADCQPSHLSFALEFSQEREEELKINENEFSHWEKTHFYALILDFRSLFRGWNIWGQLF